MEPRESAPGTGPPSRLLAIHACEVGQETLRAGQVDTNKIKHFKQLYIKLHKRL